jgi:putative SOS response-associated peptidase YedK
MCGRTLISESKGLAKQAGLEIGNQAIDKDNNRPPGTDMPVILDARPGKLNYVKWGLIPSKSETAKVGYDTAYARIETMQQLPTYRELLGRRHCVFVLNGIYEFDKSVKPSQPYFFKRKDGGVIYAAGLWDTWKDPQTGIVIPSATMVMQPANGLIKPIHSRMACILSQGEVDIWLNRELPTRERLAVLKPVPVDILEGWMVNKKVNNARNKDEDNIEPFSEGSSLWD